MRFRWTIAALALALVGCEPEKEASAPVATGGQCADVSGSWEVTTRVDKTECGEGVDTEKLTLELTQRGCSVEMPVSMTQSIKGTVSGKTVTLKGSYDSMGTITKDLKLTVDGDAITGGGKWTWSNKTLGESCGGSEKISGKRL